ncbi:pyridoxal 5'-phosphate synthase glutaminase subunit PdxT [Candidatus Bathyarchaeota archaeon]|nr:pyridoxal 5'-phosphate synthase glutaminase subunit PdxT [Candidatus Bathyarchaeota archaeon]
MLRVGILGVQGDIEEHTLSILKVMKSNGLKGEVLQVKSNGELSSIDGLIIPGGESTNIGGLISSRGLLKPIRDRLYNGMPALGTCAGLIVLAKKCYDRVVGDKSQPTLGVMDVVVERNSYGRQKESFEADLDIPILGAEKFRGVFIRAPTIVDIGSNVKVLSRLNDSIVAVQEGNIIGTTFHPELVEDTRLHRYFLEIIEGNIPQSKPRFLP